MKEEKKKPKKLYIYTYDSKGRISLLGKYKCDTDEELFEKLKPVIRISLEQEIKNPPRYWGFDDSDLFYPPYSEILSGEYEPLEIKKKKLREKIREVRKKLIKEKMLTRKEIDNYIANVYEGYRKIEEFSYGKLKHVYSVLSRYYELCKEEKLKDFH